MFVDDAPISVSEQTKMDPTDAEELSIEDRPTLPIPPPDDDALVAERSAGSDTQPPPSAELDEIGALYERIVNR